MKAETKYKETGLDWCPLIPEHWDTKRLKYTAYVQPSNVDKKTEKDELPVLLCNYVDVYKNDFINITLPFMEATAKPEEIEKYKLKVGDVIITKDSESAQDIAVPAYVKEEAENLICGYHLAQIRSNNTDIIGRYLFRLFQSKMFNSNFEIGANGITRYGLGVEVTKNSMALLPPIPEQQKIADYLDQKTSQIDTIIARKKKLIELLKEERIAIINQAVTKGLNPNAEMKPSGIDWLGDIPEHWEVKKLKYTAKIKTGRTPKIQGSSIDYFENGSVNWFTPSDFNQSGELINSKRKIVNEAIGEEQADLYPPFAIYLIGIGATLGKVGISYTEASANQQINILVFNKLIYPKYGFYYLLANKEYILSAADYTTLPILNQSKTKELNIPIPSIYEQEAIVEFLDKETQRIDAIITKAEKQIELLKEYKTALINEVVTGQMIVD